MTYTNTSSGIFLDRPNRFIANVKINDKVEKVHVRNTGRCKEILKPGTKVILEKASNPNRKTKFSLISAYKEDMIINIDSQIPNKVVYDGILNNQVKGLENLDLLKREVTFSDSRFDLYYEKDGVKGFIEVKGVTLEKDGLAMFPDAPTERGRKHIETLISTLELGMKPIIFFLIQINNIKAFRPNKEMDPKFAEALDKAQKKGVKILAYNSIVEESSIKIGEKIDFMI